MFLVHEQDGRRALLCAIALRLKCSVRPYISFTHYSDRDAEERLDFSRSGFLRFKIGSFRAVPAGSVKLLKGARLAHMPVGNVDIPLGDEVKDFGSLASRDKRATTVWLAGFEDEIFPLLKPAVTLC